MTKTASLVQFTKSVVVPFGNGMKIFRSEFRENCFVYQSFKYDESRHGDRLIKPHVSFLADGGSGLSAEWEPCYGPIQRWYECEEDWKPHPDELMCGKQATKHWHYNWVKDTIGDWSQLGVDNEGLKQMLINGDLDGVFNALMRWAT